VAEPQRRGLLGLLTPRWRGAERSSSGYAAPPGTRARIWDPADRGAGCAAGRCAWPRQGDTDPLDSLGTLIAGSLAGVAHVLLAPDHLLALLVFSAEARERAWRVGAAWGFGHAAAIALVALLLVEVREQLRLELLTQYGEYFAGLMLIAIGLWGLLHARGASREVEHSEHGHAHVHTHTGLAMAAGLGSGLVHALAGNGVLLALIPALGLTPAGARSYLLAFSLTTVLAVVALTSLLGLATALPLRGRASGRGAERAIRVISCISLAAGALWLVFTWAGVDLHGYAE
jgi:hypothetical protein